MTAVAAPRQVFAEPVVTLQEAKDQLDISHTVRDAFIQTKVDNATGIVDAWLNFNLPATPWTVATVPSPVRAAILLVLTDLFTNRGEDDPRPADGGYGLSERVRGLLGPWHLQPVA